MYGSPYHIYEGFPADHPAVNKPRAMQAVTAACMLIRTNVFALLGGFDEGYINSAEDHDLCLRAGEAGYKVGMYRHRLSPTWNQPPEAGPASTSPRAPTCFTSVGWARCTATTWCCFAADGLLRVHYQAGGRLHVGVDPELGGVMDPQPHRSRDVCR